MLGAQIGYELSNLLIGERVREWRHFLPAVQNLIGHFGRRPISIFRQLGQGRSFSATNSGRPVTVGAAFVAKKNRTGFLIRFLRL